MTTYRPSTKLRKMFWILAVLAILFMAGVYIFLSGLEYLRSSEFEEYLEAQVGGMVEGKVGLEKPNFRLQEASVYQIQVESSRGYMAQLEGAHTFWQVGEAFRSGEWKFKHPTVQQANLVLRDPSQKNDSSDPKKIDAASTPPSSDSKSKRKWSSWVPKKFTTEEIRVDRLEIESKMTGAVFKLGPMQYDIRPNENLKQWRWLASSSQGADWNLPGLPWPYKVTKAHWVIDANRLVAQEIQGRVGRDASLHLEGHKSFKSNEDWKLTGRLDGLATNELPEGMADVERIVKGRIKAEFEANHEEIQGILSLSEAQSKAPDALKLLGEVLKSDRLRTIHWDVAQSHFSHRKGIIAFENLKMESSGLLCVEGEIKIHTADSSTPKKLEGKIWLGISKSMFRWLPTLEGTLFGAKREDSPGYLWTEVILSGTTDAPVDSFSPLFAGQLQRGAIEISENAIGLLKGLVKPSENSEESNQEKKSDKGTLDEAIKIPQDAVIEGAKLLKEALPLLPIR